MDLNYPVSNYTVLDGYDIYRSNNIIIALVVVETPAEDESTRRSDEESMKAARDKKDIRLYRWVKRNDQWKVDLCRMGVSGWKWDELAEKIAEFKDKYNIR